MVNFTARFLKLRFNNVMVFGEAIMRFFDILRKLLIVYLNVTLCQI